MIHGDEDTDFTSSGQIMTAGGKAGALSDGGVRERGGRGAGRPIEPGAAPANFSNLSVEKTFSTGTNSYVCKNMPR